MLFIRNPLAFYVLRFFAGRSGRRVFPRVLWYIGNWYPASHRARAIALFSAGAPVAQAIGGILAGSPQRHLVTQVSRAYALSPSVTILNDRPKSASPEVVRGQAPVWEAGKSRKRDGPDCEPAGMSPCLARLQNDF